MNWLIDYVVLGLLFAGIAFAVGDRQRASVGTAAVWAGLLWPVVLVGFAQAALWTVAVDLVRHTPVSGVFGAAEPRGLCS